MKVHEAEVNQGSIIVVAGSRDDGVKDLLAQMVIYT